MFCPNCEKHFGGDACPRCVTSVEGKWRVPYTRPSLPPWEDVKRSFEGIYKSGMLCHGSRVAEFEKGIAEYLDTTPSRVVACSNATTGLMLLCATLAAPGEVIMPAYTFSGTVQAVEWAGLTPVLVDCMDDCNIDAGAVYCAITPETRAILAVHISGVPCDVTSLRAIAAEADIPLYVDAAHALGSKLNNDHVSKWSHADVYSLGATKVLAVGEGGVIVCREDILAGQLRFAVNHGHAPGSLDYHIKGFNARMQEFNAIIGITALPHLDNWIKKRQEIRRWYRDALVDIPGVTFPPVSPHASPTWKDVSIFVDPDVTGHPDMLLTAMARRGVQLKRYYYPPIHMLTRVWHSVYVGIQGMLDNTEKLSQRVLSLPCFTEMERDDVDFVCEAFRKIASPGGSGSAGLID